MISRVANQPVQRMAAGGCLSQVRVPKTAAIADFHRYAKRIHRN